MNPGKSLWLRKSRWLLGLLLLPTLGASASEGTAASCQARGPNVVLFTWDGVRTREFFKGTGPFHHHQLTPRERGVLFPIFWEKHAARGLVLGGLGRFKIASPYGISLPSYQALMAGHPTGCKGNGCGPIQETTVLEDVKDSLGLKKSEVAVFASWQGLSHAVARDPDNITHSIFPGIFDDGTGDPEFSGLQQLALQDLPRWGGSRKDKYTFRLAMRYLKKHCPRVLYISLVDSDEFGHQRDYPGYAASLRIYDRYLDELISTLESLGDYGRQTTLMVTTDHSRGPGPSWSGHATTRHSERSVFFYAWGRGVNPQGRSCLRGGHDLIRPTIERLLGASPTGEWMPGIGTE